MATWPAAVELSLQNSSVSGQTDRLTDKRTCQDWQTAPRAPPRQKHHDAPSYSLSDTKCVMTSHMTPRGNIIWHATHHALHVATHPQNRGCLRSFPCMHQITWCCSGTSDVRCAFLCRIEGQQRDRQDRRMNKVKTKENTGVQESRRQRPVRLKSKL